MAYEHRRSAEDGLQRPEDLRGHVAAGRRRRAVAPSHLPQELLYLDGALAAHLEVEQDQSAALFVETVNGGNQTVPTVVFPDGTALTNPSLKQITEKVGAVG